MSEAQTTAGTQVPEQHEAEPTAFMLNPGGWVALAMIVIFALHAIGRALDSKIELIRNQLTEAESLRKEAEALKAEYEAKAKSVDKDRKALLERARHEAEEIVAKAKTDAELLIERRSRMAEDKIAAEERAAVDQVRAAAADAAARAAKRLIAERHDAAADEQLVNQAIGEGDRRRRWRGLLEPLRELRCHLPSTRGGDFSTTAGAGRPAGSRLRVLVTRNRCPPRGSNRRD